MSPEHIFTTSDGDIDTNDTTYLHSNQWSSFTVFFALHRMYKKIVKHTTVSVCYDVLGADSDFGELADSSSSLDRSLRLSLSTTLLWNLWRELWEADFGDGMSLSRLPRRGEHPRDMAASRSSMSDPGEQDKLTGADSLWVWRRPDDVTELLLLVRDRLAYIL